MGCLVVKNCAVESRRLGDTLIFYKCTTGDTFILNPEATQVFELINKNQPIREDEVLRQLEPALAREAVERCLAELDVMNFIELDAS